MGHSRTEIYAKCCSIEQEDHTEVRPTSGKCLTSAHRG
jgi:hypothetical protein